MFCGEKTHDFWVKTMQANHYNDQSKIPKANKFSFQHVIS